MIIISNDCSCYVFYNKFNMQYNHPFISNRQFTEDFVNTVKYFKDIDYLNYKSMCTTRFSHLTGIRPHLKVIIDNKINVNFIHYTFNLRDTRYYNRAKRLNNIKLTDDNIIFICNENASCNNCFDELKEICNKNNYKLIYCESTNKEKLIFNKEILDKNILYINKNFKPSQLYEYIINNYDQWVLNK